MPNPPEPGRRRMPPPSSRKPTRPSRAKRAAQARSLGLVAGAVPTVAIRSPGQHPFVFRKMIEGPVGSPEPVPGDMVRAVSREGEPRGFGLWNPRSQIALRLLTNRDEPPGEAFWSKRLTNAVALRRGVLQLDTQTNAYRVVHAESDGLSGLVVDRLDDVLSAECFSLGMYERAAALLGELGQLVGTRHYRVQVDERVAVAEDFDARPLSSGAVPPAVLIHEHGVRYRIRFESGHKTGFFCDQRDNRAALAGFCADRDVLDLCCYTGGFGLNARLRGGARDVTCVDLDEQALALARENAHLNQTRINFVHADAFAYARQMASNGRKFGVVVLDPPKLIPGRDDISLGKRKYFDLNVLAMGLVESGGLLLTCSCSGLLGAEEFVALLRAAGRRAGRFAQLLDMKGAAPDHPVALDVPETSYLKAIWLLIHDV